MDDAIGVSGQELCPQCQSGNTISYYFDEGFTELECLACGYLSDSEELAALMRFNNELVERQKSLPIPIKKIKA